MRTPLLPVSLTALVAAALLAGCSPAAVEKAAPLTIAGAGDPQAWESASPADLGLDPAVLRRGADAARRTSSTCFAVARDGRLAREWDFGVPADSPREVFSVTKSVTSALVGIAARQGLLSVDDRVAEHVPAWRGTPSASVTVAQLLSNDSGRTWSEESDYVRLVGAKDRTRYAVGLRQQHRPGSAWAYNNAAIQVLDAVLREATGMPTDEFAARELFAPLGMDHSRLTRVGASTAVFFGLQSTCADLLRFGQLYLDGGEVDGEPLLDPGFVRDSLRPSTGLNAAYGYLWWLNRRGPLRGSTDDVDAAGQPLTPRSGQLAPGRSAGLFAAIGLGGQLLLADPATGTLVVRLGPVPGAGEPEYGFADAARVAEDAVH